jgi:hypothetical protein
LVKKVIIKSMFMVREGLGGAPYVIGASDNDLLTM